MIPPSCRTLTPGQHVHCIGIGGIGMSAIAQMLAKSGFHVSGSDANASATVEQLRAQGITVEIGHAGRQATNADLVVYSTAISPGNAELCVARARGIPTVQRAHLLALFVNGRRVVAVTGAHGKTTTTAMTALVLTDGGRDPLCLIGAEVEPLGGNARWGEGPCAVVEADESDGSFVFLRPTYAVITNIDREHLDFYRNLSEIEEGVRRFVQAVPQDGAIFVCAEDQRLLNLTRDLGVRRLTFGLDGQADLHPDAIARAGLGTAFDCSYLGRRVGRAQLQVPGLHNVSNAMAAIGVALQEGVPWDSIAASLARYPGAHRRFQRIQLADDITLVDDYAHHPTEVNATLAALPRGMGRRTIAVFQPHRYSRTKYLAAAFGGCFAAADQVIITDVYAASETPLEGVSGQQVYDAVVHSGHPHAEYVERARLVDHVLGMMQPGDVIFFLGAGDISELCRTVAQRSARPHLV